MNIISKGAKSTEENSFKYPGGFNIEKIDLYSFDDKNKVGIDIRGIVKELSIEESITSYSLLCKITLVDGINVMEELQLSGNEKIKIIIKRKDPFQKLTKIELDFIVAEYPLYGKGPANKSQMFDILAVSNHGFVNSLMTLSKVLKGSTPKIIENILVTELNYKKDKIKVLGDFKNDFTYIAPNIRPFEIISTIIRMSADSLNSPVLAYETLQNFHIRGMSEVFKSNPYKDRTYSLNQTPVYTRDADQRFIQELTSILQMSSNLRMSKMEQASDGAFASTLQHYNIATKEYKEQVFNILEKKPQLMSKEISYAQDFEVNDKRLNTYVTSTSYEIITSNEEKSLNFKQPYHIMMKESSLAMLDNMTHDITLYGDLEFECGNIINLEIPNNSKKSTKDEHISGKYLVTTVKHNFMPDGYKMDVKLTKDGYDKKLSIS